MLKINYKYLALYFFLVIVSTAITFWVLVKNNPPPHRPHLKINGQTIYVEVADTQPTRAKGLSGRETMARDEGMLFVFGQKGRFSFWMNQMNFNLDFIYFENQVVVNLVENVPFPKRGEAPVSVDPGVEFDKILEVNQGTIKRLDVKIGDQAEFFL